MSYQVASRIFRRLLTFGCGVVLLSVTAIAQQYTQTNLISNDGRGGTKPDANLINGWGLARGSSTPWWVADNGSGVSTLYAGDGTILPLVVTVSGSPTGVIFNATEDFKVNGAPAKFIFASEDGTISAWNGGTQASVVVPAQGGTIYKGLAIAKFRGANYLYATDFHNGKVDVYDANFQLKKRVFDGDGDRDSDDFPFFAYKLAHRGFAPFGIQNIGGTIFVTFAKQDDDKHDDVAGSGNGLLTAFTPGGKLIRIFEHGPWLNSPWGITLAPDDFGAFSHYLLVGQFGSGQIAAYNIASGKFAGRLHNDSGKVLAIDGLWGVGFGNGGNAGPANTLFFAAGPNHESEGLFGTLTVTKDDPSVGNSQ
ncbi:MAG TPA: TIGR03118 family protein [Bryobacteraceae bacterium]|nr:TIGR03118 family protein [Bryobacteraceae bacterium]